MEAAKATGMSDRERMDRMRFVEDRLSPVILEATEGYVPYLSYRHGDGDDEWVILHVDDRLDGCPSRVVRVSIACDSLWAIVKDVARAVAEVYE